MSVARLSHYDGVLFYLNLLKLLEAYSTHSVFLKKQSNVFCLGLLFSSTVKEGSGAQFGVRRDGRDRLPHRTHEAPQVRQHRQVIFSIWCMNRITVHRNISYLENGISLILSWEENVQPLMRSFGRQSTFSLRNPNN